MFTEKRTKLFVALALVSFLGLLGVEQFLTSHRVAMYLRDSDRKLASAQNHSRLQDARFQRELLLIKSGALASGSGDDHHGDSDTGHSAEISSSHATKDTAENMSTASSTGVPGARNSLDLQAPFVSPAKTPSSQNSLGKQQTTPSSPATDRRPRLPSALIIGFAKCGTAALRTFLTIHPDVVSPILEVRYFTLYHSKELEWYRKQMPPSTRDQVTIEKTPSYIMINQSLRRIHDFDPKIKLIVIVRDPIVRLQSQYAHEFCQKEPNHTPTFIQWLGETPERRKIARSCHYARYIRRVYNLFPRKQVLILSEDDMERNPLPVLKEAEKFLELRPAYSDDMFVFNETKGFHCFNTQSKLFSRVLELVQVKNATGCLGKSKGREHPKIEGNYLKVLKKTIQPLNEELFDLIGKRFQWDNFRDKS
ncbi:heparan sulfate glucosamine 3-O-sulfotransferase [Elysia marginata]|uniref:Heparan sulfate glucosamine 3-O-sulfotransferase n=1 Tax=Elysia marginata TaxID=1093978 RepID=A0AAV4FMB1_9GAST|nr:heparan sulfate glucosamine 3-O-sulfotransferase [Elysia marginata]